MYNNNNILVVIPARGGSKGIPRKNCRILGDKPLISYVIEMAKSSEYVDDIIVSTEDDEIALISEKFGVEVVKRPEELSADDVPLDPVIFDALIQKERLIMDEYDIVITIQPTSPLLKVESLNKAIEKFDSFDIDTVISVVDDSHLRWGHDEREGYFPLYSKRLNRQYLPKTFKETGSILASRRSVISPDSRLGEDISLIKLPFEESVDIDTYQDWAIAEHWVNRKKIAIKTDANYEIGTGHIYRGLSLASKLVNHDVLFFLKESETLGIRIVKDNNYRFVIHEDETEFFESIDKFKPDIVINDILDTEINYMAKLKERGIFTINFEDVGEGIKYADLVFDALYENKESYDNIYTGYKYYILKDEFFYQHPKIIKAEVNNILLTFGGTDPNNLTEKVLNAILNSGFPGNVTVILGIGYANKKEFSEKYGNLHNVIVIENVRNISEYMSVSDLIFTSAGRTMYEVASIGVPCICLCQNEREMRHEFGSYENGFINMGLGSELSEEEIIEQLNSLVSDYELRLDLNRNMISVDLKHGFENIWSIVKCNYLDHDLKKK